MRNSVVNLNRIPFRGLNGYPLHNSPPPEVELHEASPAHQALQQGGAERLSALHCRLQQEAEKIRKWKNATEVEIKQKVRW